MHVDYEATKKKALNYILLLGVVTIVEVIIALLGKGYIVPGLHFPTFLIVLVMIGLSAFKAYSIMKEYMHLGYEVPAFSMTIVLPSLLLVWGIIAFLWEGNTWGNRRERPIAPEQKQEQKQEGHHGSVIKPANQIDNVVRAY